MTSDAHGVRSGDAQSSGDAVVDGSISDDDVAVGEVVEDDLTHDRSTSDASDAVEAQLEADLLAAAVEADELGLTAEEAVVEAVDLAQRMESERDELRDLVQRVKADFDNYKRRVEAQRVEQRATAALGLVEELLPVLDACDAGVVAGHDDILPIQSQLTGTLEKRGLVRVAEVDVEFDPNVHEAVLHEEGDGDPLVVEVLRPGYLWNGHVVRPAMVKVKG
ncbi:MAG: nucleotide exchange factor GrpE [Actinobacteria bacterium]|nr:nucleotide exchange factor GrpE [Actinomycetota bacterium]